MAEVGEKLSFSDALETKLSPADTVTETVEKNADDLRKELFDVAPTEGPLPLEIKQKKELKPVTKIDDFRRLFILSFRRQGHIRTIVLYIKPEINEAIFAMDFCKRLNLRFINIVPFICFEPETILSEEALVEVLL